MDYKFDFKDVTIVPEILTDISHRYMVNPYNEDEQLPLMVSPMDTVVSEDNYKKFKDAGYVVCTPRGVITNDEDVFVSMSLDEFEEYFELYKTIQNEDIPIKILIDIANGHMKRLYEIVDSFYKNRHSEKHMLMVGNIANPATYQLFANIGVDYVRVGIGGGSGCLTSANIGIHYPMASLVNECYLIKKSGGYKTKIVADGGFRNYDDVIKALMLGADYVMLGGILNKTLESCGETKLFKKIPLSESISELIWVKFPKLRKYMYKSFRGMSTKEVQKKWKKRKLKTSEGISKLNKIEYTLNQWTGNFVDYLKSAMSYTNSINLEQFKDSDFILITENSLKRFNK